MPRILVFLLAVGVLHGCATLPTRVQQSASPKDYWVTYADWSRDFIIDAPGRFAIRPADDNDFVEPLAPRSYTLDRGTLRFSVIAVQRAREDERNAYEVAEGNGVDLQDWDRIPGLAPSFQRHVYLDGKLYRQRIVFTRRMVYELLVSGPADVFPDYAARRFFDSFTVMIKT